MVIIKAETDSDCEQVIKSFARTPQSAIHLIAMFECHRAAGNGPKEALKLVAQYYGNVLIKIMEKNALDNN